MKVWLSVVIVVFFLLNLIVTLNAEAMQLLDASFNRAMVAFGLAKGLNAVISLIQGTELSFTPVGVGINFSVGEVLDPFNDIVERFSWVMLFSSISLGVQKLLLILSGKLFLQLALGVSAIVAVGALWIKKLQNTLFLNLTLKFFALLIILRFSAIVFVYSSQFMYDSLLQNEYKSATKVIGKTQLQLEEIEKSNKIVVESKKKSGFFDSLGDKYTTLVDNLNISKRIDSLKESIDKATRNIITLMTVFVFQTVLFPLFFLWIVVWLVRWIFAYDNNKLKLLYNN